MEASPPRRRRIWPWAVATIPITLAGLSWWLTAPLDSPSDANSAPPAQPKPAAPDKPGRVAWPDHPIDGEPAKRFLLGFLEAAESRLGSISGYTATLRKQERIRGKLGVEQTLEMKVRHKPFSIYFKYVAPTPGREILYVEGKHDNKLIAHSNDFAGLLLPRVPIDPKSSIALADNRHPITEAGLANLTSRLIGFRRLDLTDADAKTVLDTLVDEQGRSWYRSLHVHEQQDPARPFYRVEVLYDPDSKLPRRITSFDWPAAGGSADPPLAEKYSYDNVKLDAPLTELDFDLANPAYGFRRF